MEKERTERMMTGFEAEGGTVRERGTGTGRLVCAVMLACAMGPWCRPALGQATTVSIPGSIVASPAQGAGQGVAQGAAKVAPKGVAGSTVTLHPLSRVEAAYRTLAPMSATADKDGNLKVDGVVPGSYSVCVRVVNDELLNPCEWNPAGSLLTVQAGKDPGRLDLTLVRGTTMVVTVKDPNQIVPTPFQKKAAGLVQVGVYSADGIFHPAHYVSTDKKTHTYELVIPLDTDLKLWVESAGIQVTDAKGNRVDRVKGMVVRAETGKAAVKLEYSAAVAK